MAERADVDILIVNGHPVDPLGEYEEGGGIAVVGAEIVAVGRGIDPSRAKRVIDAAGMRVLPGVVDSHVHLPSGLTPDGARAAHGRLALSGVTTAVEFAHFSQMLDEWHDGAAGLTLLGVEGMPAYTTRVSRHQVRDEVARAVRAGAIGVKILGGHFPSTPEATEQIIDESTKRGLYTAFHAGTTRYGSNFEGMCEALELADGRPLHLAHTNAYLRGAVHDLVDENLRALSELRRHPRVVSESHLAPLNLSFGGFDGDLPTDHIARNCLALEGYDVSLSGVERAMASGRAYVHVPSSPVPITGADALAAWDPVAAPMLSFPVNRRLTAYMQAAARISPRGRLEFEGEGSFIVDAISSDGGGWRNLILDQGILMVHFGALTWEQLAYKTSLRPAQLFGLDRKGRLQVGFDADIAIVDEATRVVHTTIASGRVIAEGGRVTGSGGVVLTTEEGAPALRERDIPYRVHHLEHSAFLTKGTR